MGRLAAGVLWCVTHFSFPPFSGLAASRKNNSFLFHTLVIIIPTLKKHTQKISVQKSFWLERQVVKFIFVCARLRAHGIQSELETKTNKYEHLFLVTASL